MTNPRRRRILWRGFTLVELMTSISVIGVLVALSLTALATAKKVSRRTVCLGNLKQFGVASQMYATDDRKGRYADTISDRDDNQNWLYPTYITTLKSFSCPATRNTVRNSVFETNSASDARRLVDLVRFARDKDSFGTSYEVYGFMNYNGGTTTELVIDGTAKEVAGIQKTETSVASYVHKNSNLGLSGIVPGPSRVWLMLDADPAIGNYPGTTANHRKEGLNVQFCDGHVTWITPRHWLDSYECSQDEGLFRP